MGRLLNVIFLIRQSLTKAIVAGTIITETREQLLMRVTNKWLAVTDCTGLFMDEVQTVAESLGKSGTYATAKSDICYAEIRKYARLLGGRSIEEVSGWMASARPFPGARNSIQALKNAGYEIHVISDNALLALPAAYQKLYQLGVNSIHPTSRLDMLGGYFTGNLDGCKPKSEIVMELVERIRPSRLLGIGHESNDREMLETVKDFGGTTIAIGNEVPADHNVQDLNEFAKLIPMLR